MKSAALLLLLVSLAHGAPLALEVKPKAVEYFEAPLSAKVQKMAVPGGNTPPATARCAVAVPEGFTPARAWPILIWNASQGGSAVDSLDGAAPAANEAGWIVLAADGATPAKVETTEWCTAMLAAAYDRLERAWPTVRSWPIASGGFSGGAKRAPYVGAMLMENRFRLTGLFLGGINEDRATDALKWHKPGEGFKAVPIYLSTGMQDSTATEEQFVAVAESLKKSGFTRVRREIHGGDHALYGKHLEEALRWFAQPVAGGR